MCPLCDQPLIAFELDGVEIDRCVRCQGVWLDAGELEWLAHLADVEPGRLSAALSGASRLRTARLRCPRCTRKLDAVRLGGAASVEVERCPRGDGFWFERGEMEAFFRSFRIGEEGALARFLLDFHGQGGVWHNLADESRTQDQDQER